MPTIIISKNYTKPYFPVYPLPNSVTCEKKLKMLHNINSFRITYINYTKLEDKSINAYKHLKHHTNNNNVGERSKAQV